MTQYSTKWAIVKAKNNKVITKKDKKTLCSSLTIMDDNYEKEVVFFGNVKEKIEKAKGKLSKEMEVLFITDKQFGMMKTNNFNNDWWLPALQVATSKQKREIITIK